MLMASNRAEYELKANRVMGTIVDEKTRGLYPVKVLRTEVAALGISVRDITRDGSRMVGKADNERSLSPAVLFRFCR